MIVTGKTRNGWFDLESAEFKDVEKYCKKNDRVYINIEITKKSSKRSVQANRFYWGILLKEFSDLTGTESEILHNIFKSKYLKKIRSATELEAIEKFNGEIKDSDLTYIQSTTELSSQEFYNYVEKCISLYIEYGGSFNKIEYTELKTLREKYEK